MLRRVQHGFLFSDKLQRHYLNLNQIHVASGNHATLMRAASDRSSVQLFKRFRCGLEFFILGRLIPDFRGRPYYGKMKTLLLGERVTQGDAAASVCLKVLINARVDFYKEGRPTRLPHNFR